MTVLSKKKKIKYNRAETRAAWILLLPSVIGLTCITYLPMLASFTLSLFNWNGLGEMKFVGMETMCASLPGTPSFTVPSLPPWNTRGSPSSAAWSIP